MGSSFLFVSQRVIFLCGAPGDSSPGLNGFEIIAVIDEILQIVSESLPKNGIF